MWEAIAAAIGVAGALLGAWLKSRSDLGKLRAEHAREDHNHRQAYYHDLQVTATNLMELAWHTFPGDAAGPLQVVEGQFMVHVKGVRTFGTPSAREAAKLLEGAWNAGDESGMRDALEMLEEAAVADVGPS